MSAAALNWFLVAQYVVLCAWYLLEHNYLKAQYWLGAAIISSSVALMP